MTFYEISEKLYEIEKELAECVDEETGEILDDKYAELMQNYTAMEMEEQDKTEGVCLLFKEKQMFIDELKAEKKRIADRISVVEKDAERLKKFIDEFVLKGKKFETSKVRCQYRKTKSVEVADESIVPEEYMVEKVSVAPDKMKIKKALSDGEIVRGCNLIEGTSLSIK